MLTEPLPNTLDVRKAAARGVSVSGAIKPVDLHRFRELLVSETGSIQAELVLSKAGSLVDVSSQQARLDKARDLAGVGKYGQARDIALEVQKEADAMHKKAVRKDRR